MGQAKREGRGVPRTGWGCAVVPLAGVATGMLGSVLLAAAWRACDVGVNGPANSLALVLYGSLLTLAAVVWWGVIVGYVGRRSLPVALLGGPAGAVVLVWTFVALLQVPHGYSC
ncbi:hypothetical protein [Streptomyces sp. NPDC007369]|uniref:hypothetical protein n=1 Tax=Streptomyces sp. NPDC007369 TaxID=3154589 RepID=UPI0033D626C6